MDDGYRDKILVLPTHGDVPTAPDSIDMNEQGAMLSTIAALWEFVEAGSAANRRRLNGVSVPTGAETFLARKRWSLSHHLFIPELALTGDALQRASEFMERGIVNEAKVWVDLAARMRKGCAALFMYSTDFEPCAEIYCGRIRSQMPPALSGYEIRERQNSFLPGLEAFKKAFPKNSSDTFVAAMREMWVAADLRYHELHERCMVASVQGSTSDVGDVPRKPESLRAAYRRVHGDAPPITEERYHEYDNHFQIKRREGTSRIDYAYQLADVIERVVADLMIGHRLEATVSAELFDSMRAILIVLARWAGPVTEASLFYPKTLRGE